MPPNVSSLTLSSAVMSAVVGDLGVRPAAFAAEPKTTPAAQPMVATAPNDEELTTDGEYLAIAACMALVAGMESSNHGTSCTLPTAPFTADCDSHGVVISPAVDT